KLEWPALQARLASLCRTEAGQELGLNLTPNLDRAAIEERWREVEPLQKLAESGYIPPIGEQVAMENIFRSIKLRQILTGEALRTIFSLLTQVKHLHLFCENFESPCLTLKLFRANTYPLP